jgi:DNA-binding MarR family transcriptional regulator
LTESDAARAHAAMTRLVLRQRDPRQLVEAATGISFTRARVLRRLLAGPARMSELAARLGSDKPYVTIMVDDLEQRGLVTRIVAPDDRRAKVVALTDAGRELAAEAERVLAEPAPGLARLDAEELATLVRLLEKASAAGAGDGR